MENAVESKPISRAAISSLLQRHGIMPTNQRIEIAHILFFRRRHLSAEQILALANKRGAQTSKATVYNTLKLFLEKKLIREVIVDSARVLYDPNTLDHHHIYDMDSGDLMDVDAKDVRVLGLPPLGPGVVIERIDVIVRIRGSAAV